MIIEAIAIVFAASFTLSGALTELARRRAIAAGRHDVPNERSSHERPTPRGGGIGLAVTLLVCTPLLLGREPLALALAAGGAVNALSGYLDDRVSLSARVRLLAQAIAGCGLATAWGWSALALAPGIVLPALLAPLFVVLFAVWMTNLYNFMDGIDGIAGSQAVTASLTLSALSFAHHQHFIGLFGLAIAGASAGFLTRNWPPARIFMGDVGSGFLGFVFAAYALIGVRGGAFGLAAVAIVLSPFVVDATYTLLRRALRRKRLWQAHRSHAYQRLARRAGRHLPVTAATLGLGAFVLAPLAALSELAGAASIGLVGAVWAILGVGAWAVGAGLDDNAPDPLGVVQRP